MTWRPRMSREWNGQAGYCIHRKATSNGDIAQISISMTWRLIMLRYRYHLETKINILPALHVTVAPSFELMKLDTSWMKLLVNGNFSWRNYRKTCFIKSSISSKMSASSYKQWNNEKWATWAWLRKSRQSHLGLWASFCWWEWNAWNENYCRHNWAAWVKDAIAINNISTNWNLYITSNEESIISVN